MGSCLGDMQWQTARSDYDWSWQNLDMIISQAELQQKKMWCCFNDLVSVLELMGKPLFANQVVEWAISWLRNILSWWASEFCEGFGSGWVPYIGSRPSLSAAAASSSRIASCPWALILASSRQSHGARKCKLFVHLSRHMMVWQVVGSHPCGCMLELNQLGNSQDVNLETNCNDSKWSRLMKE
jgi:hypothetical protein